MVKSRIKYKNDVTPESLFEAMRKSTREKRELFMRRWALGTDNLYRDAARSQHGRGKSPRTRGGSFWSNIAALVKRSTIDPYHFVIYVDDSASGAEDNGSTPSAKALFRHTGGQLTARNKAFLTIPVNKDSYGKAAGDFKDAGLFRPRNRFFLAMNKGKGKRKKMKILFALKKTVTQKERPWIPTEKDALGVAKDALESVR